MVEYKNRYGDEYTFTKQEDGTILWEGPFEHVRIGFPNVYKAAYQQYPEGWRSVKPARLRRRRYMSRYMIKMVTG